MGYIGAIPITMTGNAAVISGAGPGGAADALLLESGVADGLLLETGDYLLLE